MAGDKGGMERLRPESSTIASLLRPISEPPETLQPYIPFAGGPRLFFLLLYASVLVVTSIEFFADMRVWYGSWELYNTYVFVVSGLFVFLGMMMLFSWKRAIYDTYKFPFPRDWIWTTGFVMLAVSGVALVVIGKDIGGWAVLLSVLLVYGFVLMVLGTPTIEPREAFRLFVFGTGLMLMILVPVHEAFGVARSQHEDWWFFSFLNLLLFVPGIAIAVIGLQSLRTKDGFFGAWLMGAMAIFLIAFHEQLGIVASGNYSPYDRALALIGIAFSFLPLGLYVVREKVYLFLWRRLRIANLLISQGKYKDALKHTDEAIRESYRAGIEDKFAVPWTIKGDALYRMKDYTKAEVSYETALEIEPKDTVSWTHLGNMFAFEGKYEKAINSFDEALQVDPTNAYAWNNKGAVYQFLKMDEQALISFDKSIQYLPENFDAHINMAKVLSRMGHSDEALPHYQAALRIKPDSEIAKEGIRKEFFTNMCTEQIRGWEQIGLDTTELKKILEQDPTNFVKKSKELLKNIVDQKTKLSLVPWKEHLDMTAAIQKILKITEPPGASLETIAEGTHLKIQDLVLPLALLMETDHVHFAAAGRKELYISEGKAPEKPPEKPPERAPEPAPPAKAPLAKAKKEKKEAKPKPAKKAPAVPVPGRFVILIKCPGCGHHLIGDEKKCPMCDLPLETASLDCPVCLEEVDFSASTCPKCGAIFRAPPTMEEIPEEAEAEAEAEEVAEEPEAEKAKPEKAPEKKKGGRIFGRKKEKPAPQKPKKEAPPPPEKKIFRRPPSEPVEPTASILIFRRKKS